MNEPRTCPGCGETVVDLIDYDTVKPIVATVLHPNPLIVLDKNFASPVQTYSRHWCSKIQKRVYLSHLRTDAFTNYPPGHWKNEFMVTARAGYLRALYDMVEATTTCPTCDTVNQPCENVNWQKGNRNQHHLTVAPHEARFALVDEDLWPKWSSASSFVYVVPSTSEVATARYSSTNPTPRTRR